MKARVRDFGVETLAAYTCVLCGERGPDVRAYVLWPREGPAHKGCAEARKWPPAGGEP